MLPVLTAHLKPIFSGLSVLLQTTLARLLPCLWWSAPANKLFHLPPLVIMSGRPQSCYCSLSSSSSFSKQRWCVFHTSHCSLTRPVLWSLPHSGLAPAAQTLWFPQTRRRPGPFLGGGLFSQLWQSHACYRPPLWWPWKIWWLIWGSDVTNTLNQKFNTSWQYKCALSNIKIVWTHFREHIITVQGNCRCSSFKW